MFILILLALLLPLLQGLRLRYLLLDMRSKMIVLLWIP